MLNAFRQSSVCKYTVLKLASRTHSYSSSTSIHRTSSALRNVFEKRTDHTESSVHEKLVHNRRLNAKLVIFDKDGTLICFDSMWVPWAKKIAAKLGRASNNKSIAHKVYMTLGVCHRTLKISPGLLAEGTTLQIRNSLANLLIQEGGVDPAEATTIVVRCMAECKPDKLVELHDLRRMFRALRQHGLKTAVCTADTRLSTLDSLRQLNISHLVDKIVCGDDPTGLPKPNPHNALMICDALNVHPKQAVMVGDTTTDMQFGRNAGLGCTYGVLTGIGQRKDLAGHGTVIVNSVQDVLFKVLPNRSIKLSTRGKAIRSTPWKLVITDKDGTLADINARWREWTLKTASKLEKLTSREIVDKFYVLVGLDPQTLRIEGAMLAEGTVQDLRDGIEQLLMLEGVLPHEAEEIMEKIWEDGSDIPDMVLPRVLETLKELKRRGVKLAICTTDLRRSVTSFLERSGLEEYIDAVVAADDLDPDKAKPLPHGVLLLCDQLQVSPSEVVMVGDTRSDMLCGRAARVGARIGVLSGVSTPEYVMQYADVLIPDVSYLLELVRQPTSNRQTVQDTSQEVLFTPSSSASSISRRIGNLPGQPIRSLHTSTRASSSNEGYDYVIVGAGSAGCVVANRLTEDSGTSAVLLEAGPKDHPLNWMIHMPAALTYTLSSDTYNWYYHTVPQKHMDKRVMYWPRGRVWGGSSSINAMEYVRGHAYDYDRWEQEGARGWSYADCLPYFRKAQTHELGADEYRGGDGPLHVSRSTSGHVLHEAWLQAGVEAGYGFTDDMNGYKQEGVGYNDLTIHKGKRWSTSDAYLRPVLDRPNLHTKTKVLATKVLLDGKRAVGVEYEENGKKHVIEAHKEVILCGGTINSPQLLLLSGIGRASELEQVGVSPTHELPGVGRNLQDHLELYVQNKCSQPITLYSAQWKFPHNMIAIGLRWFAFRTGWGASSHLESGGFVRSGSSVKHPDIQFHFLPSTVYDHGRVMGPCHAYQVHVGPMRPTSVGKLWLKSKNPGDHPLIDANYLATERDRWEMRQSILLSREILAQPAFAQFDAGELQPGAEVKSDSDLDAFVRRSSDTAYHPCCTCKMGDPSLDETAVVDHECRVAGIDSLRVVDASVMPSIVSGNLNAPTIMLAEKAVDAIRGRDPLPRSLAKVWRTAVGQREHSA